MNTNKKKIIVDVFGGVLPRLNDVVLKLNDIDCATLLGIAEGMAIKADQLKEAETENRPAE